MTLWVRFDGGFGVLSGDAITVHGGDMFGVLDASSEDETRFPATGLLDDLGAGRSHEVVGVHEMLDLVGDELTAPHMQTGGVGLRFSCLADQR